MKYEAPEMEIAAVKVNTAIAVDVEIEEDFGGMLSENSMPK